MIFDKATRILVLQQRIHTLQERNPVTNYKLIRALQREVRNLAQSA